MEWTSPWRSLKTRIAVVTSLLWVVGLGSLTVILGTRLQGDLKDLLSRHSLSLVQVIGDQLDEEIALRMDELEVLAATLSGAPLGDKAHLQHALDADSSLPLLFNSGAFVTGRDGVALASIPPSAGRVGKDYANRDHVRRALDQGLSSVGEVVVGQAINQPVFSLGVPIRGSDGSVEGCLVGVIDLSKPSFLDQVSDNHHGLSGNYIVLVSRPQRMIISATDRTRVMEVLPAVGVNPHIDAFLAGGGGTDVLVNPQGVEVLVAVHQLKTGPWYAAVAAPTADVFRPVRNLQDRMGQIVWVITLLVAFLNWLYLRHELVPALAAIKAMSELSGKSGAIEPLVPGGANEIAQMIESFNRLLKELKEREAERVHFEALANRTQKLEALGLLAGGIAHDFNNLLAAIFANVELALMKSAGGPAVPHLRKTLATVDRARGLSRQLLTFSRGGEPIRTTDHLFPFVEETARFALSGSGTALEIETATDLWPSSFDKNQLGQVVENLVLNAVQAMNQEGRLTVKASNHERDAGRFVQITFTDTGPGMTSEVQDHLFEPFFTTKHSGHGLGLSTCYSIVQKHGGTIDFTTELGKGTSFRITLPASDEQPSTVEAREPPPSSGSGTVLIMDDEPEVRHVLEESLHSLGYEVLSSANGAEVIEKFFEAVSHGRRPRAVILDLTVPGGMGGVEAAAMLHAQAPDVPLLIASGFSHSPALVNPEAFGFSGVLRKPYLRADLARLLHDLLG